VGDNAHRQALAAQAATESNMTVQKMLSHSSASSPKSNEQRFGSFDIESKMINMNIASREASSEVQEASRPLQHTAKIMKNLQKGFRGPLAGLVKNLISGKQLHMTENMCQKANFFFWMSPNHCTRRLMKPAATLN